MGKPPLDYVGLAEWGKSENHIGFPAMEAGNSEIRQQFDSEIRVPIDEFREWIGKDVRCKPIGGREAKDSAQAFLAIHQLALELKRLVLDILGVDQHGFTGVGQPKSIVRSLEERRSRGFFEATQLPPGGRLRDFHARGCRSQCSGARDCEEQPQMVPVEGGGLSEAIHSCRM